MIEMVCSRCNAQSPENALYCQQCGQPLQCKNCHAQLLPTARACIQCGQLIPERINGEQFHTGIDSVPLGYNRLKMHETPDIRDIDLVVSNDAIEHIRDFFPPLVGNRPSGRSNSAVNHQAQHKTDLLEVTSEAIASRPQLIAASSYLTTPQEGIWAIFRNREGRLIQERSDLKASNKRDYIVRLAHLYMYAKCLLDQEKVPREEVFKILDEASVKDNHRSTYLAESGIRTDENETLRLTLEGRDRAQQYITEVLDAQAAEGWRPSSPAHSASSRIKKPSKKSDEQRNDVIAEWVSNDVTKGLVKTFSHSIIATLSQRDKSLFALYCLDKVGVNTEVQASQLSEYLFKAFQIQIDRSNLHNSLFSKAVNNKPPYATFRKGSGFRITGTGSEYIEGVLKNKQAQSTTVTSIEANGVNP